MNFQGAFRGLRNPMNSWDKSDSYWDMTGSFDKLNRNWDTINSFYHLGPKDLDLAMKMIKAGSSDRKFLRQIMVSVDITAPLYWWKQFDTYKVGTVANSTSTMHKLASTPITLQCFELDDYNSNLDLIDDVYLGLRVSSLIDDLEQLRQLYLQTKDKRYWKELIRWLPNGWLQTRTVTLNYEVLRNIFFQRRNHKLTQWHQFCNWIQSLPYADKLITYEA